MGHEIVRCGTRSASFNDADLWLLRHFALEALKDIKDGGRAELKGYFERWSWEGPGVYVGTDLEDPVVVAHALDQVIAAIRQKLRAFDGSIPASYLQTKLAPSLIDWRGDFPVDILLKAVDQFEFVALGRPTSE
jgi:hypothetical protein